MKWVRYIFTYNYYADTRCGVFQFGLKMFFSQTKAHILRKLIFIIPGIGNMEVMEQYTETQGVRQLLDQEYDTKG